MMYDGEAKGRIRRTLLKWSVDHLIAHGRKPTEIRALVLVDPKQKYALDVVELERRGVQRGNIYAVCRNWTSPKLQVEFRDVIQIETDAKDFFCSADCPVLDLAYLDFCKPLPNEKNEHQITCMWNLLTRRRLASPGALALNFNLDGYFDPKNDAYRSFMLEYVRADYSVPSVQDGRGCVSISVECLSSGRNVVAPDLFSPKWRKAEYEEQHLRILRCFMRRFIEDMVEKVIPVYWEREKLPLELGDILDRQPVIHSNGHVAKTLRPRRCLDLLHDRLSNLLRMLEEPRSRAAEDLSRICRGAIPAMRAALAGGRLRGLQTNLASALRVADAAFFPYRSGCFWMMPVVMEIVDERQVSLQDIVPFKYYAETADSAPHSDSRRGQPHEPYTNL